jgi:pseudouridylate synthase
LARKQKYILIILKKVKELTERKSLVANIALVKNNARVGAKIAASLAKQRFSL